MQLKLRLLSDGDAEDVIVDLAGHATVGGLASALFNELSAYFSSERIATFSTRFISMIPSNAPRASRSWISASASRWSRMLASVCACIGSGKRAPVTVTVTATATCPAPAR